MCVEIVDSIKHLLIAGKPYAFVGHSFGAWVAYEVIRYFPHYILHSHL